MARPGGKDRGLYEHPKGSAIWWVCWFDKDGKRNRQKAGTKANARLLYAKRQAEKLEGKILPERNRREKLAPTIREAYHEFEAELKAKRTWKRDEEHVRCWEAALPGARLDQIQPRDLERWKLEAARSYAPATCNRHLAFLRRLFSLALRDGLLESSPFTRGKVKLLVENNARCRYLDDKELASLREKMDPKAWLLVELAILTGLRQEEQFTLRWASVNFTTRFLTIPRSKHGLKRNVPLNDRAVEILRDLKEDAAGSQWVFPSKNHGRFGPDGKSLPETHLAANNFCRRRFKPALDQAGIEDFHWHDLRHCFASKLAMAGVDLLTLKELLGHRTLTMVMRYAHLQPQHQHAAVAKLL
ncbi:MAG: hypothetical protein AMXMBFR33_02080 [Candidatus Xenobia bacterium]